MKKKGYYFTIDAIIAALILIAGLVLISVTNKTYPTMNQGASSSGNIINILAVTKIKELCKVPACDCSDNQIEVLCNNGKIKNPDNTLLELFGELYKNEGCSLGKADSKLLVESIIKDNEFSDNFGISIDRITCSYDNDKVISETASGSSLERINSKMVVSSKKAVFGYWEDTSSGLITYWGPYTIEVITWQ